APSAICRNAIAVDLWVLAWGRTRTPAARANSAIFAILRSSASRSIISAGVSTSATGTPISAGGGVLRSQRALDATIFDGRLACPRRGVDGSVRTIPRIGVAEAHQPPWDRCAAVGLAHRSRGLQ